jgi:hypothetical protein
MAGGRAGERVTVLLLSWVVIVSSSPSACLASFGKGKGYIYHQHPRYQYHIIILTPDLHSTRPFWPTRTTRKSGILVRSGFVIIATPLIPPSTNRRLPSLRHLIENHREARNTIHHRSRAVDIRFATAISSGLSIAASSSHTLLADRDLLDPSSASSLSPYITQTP